MANWTVIKDDVVIEGNQIFRVSISASNGVDSKFNKVYLVKSEDELITQVKQDIASQETAKTNEVKFTKGVLTIPVDVPPVVDQALQDWKDARSLYHKYLNAVSEGYFGAGDKVVSDAKASAVSKFKPEYLVYL